MDVRRLTESVEQLARESDPEQAGNVLLLYIAPGDGGLHVFRVGCGLHQVGGGAAADRKTFAASMRAAVERLWPESTKQTRQYLQIACDFLARSPIVRMLSGSVDARGAEP